MLLLHSPLLCIGVEEATEAKEMSSETESIRALSQEVCETVTLTREFYSCVVKDLRQKNGAYKKVPSPTPPSEEEVENTLKMADRFSKREKITTLIMERPADLPSELP